MGVIFVLTHLDNLTNCKNSKKHVKSILRISLGKALGAQQHSLKQILYMKPMFETILL